MIIDEAAGDEAGCNAPVYFPVLTTLASATTRARTLGAMVELSFRAGRDGDTTDDWRADMRTALDNAFPSLRPPRRDELERLLTAAFYAGADQAVIDDASRPDRAMQAAQAKAALHGLNYDLADGARTAALEARATAYLLAHKLPIGADEAAACAIDALREAGFDVPARESSFVLEGAANGVEEREAWEAASREYQSREASALDSILGEALA
jgi:hypothetical protein